MQLSFNCSRSLSNRDVRVKPLPAGESTWAEGAFGSLSPGVPSEVACQRSVVAEGGIAAGELAAVRLFSRVNLHVVFQVLMLIAGVVAFPADVRFQVGVGHLSGVGAEEWWWSRRGGRGERSWES